jgi:hypothetical protein
MHKSVALCLTMLVCSVCTVEAGWRAIEDDDPFSKKLTFIAISDEGVGFRCSNRDDIQVVVISDQRATDDVAARFANADVNINVAIFVDDERFDLMADLDTTREKFVRAITQNNAIVVTEAAAFAKKRIAVAIQIAGETIHRVNPGIRGASDAIGKLVKGCGLEMSKPR